MRTGAAGVLTAPVGLVRDGYGTKTMPLGVSGPMTGTLPSAPVFRVIVPRELAAMTPVGVALSAKKGATAGVLAPAFRVTANTAGADAGALPEVPGADALIRIFPLNAATASVPPRCASVDGV